MRPTVPLLPALCLVVGLACASRTGTTQDDKGPAQAADFTLRTMDGQNFRLSDHLGKEVILINFWATWCVPCLGEMPELEKLYQAHRGQGLLIVGVSMDGPETIANVQPTARRYGVTFPILLDEETRVVGVYNPRRDAPFSVLIDREGRVVERFVGYAPGDEAKLDARIRPLLTAAQPESQPESER